MFFIDLWSFYRSLRHHYSRLKGPALPAGSCSESPKTTSNRGGGQLRVPGRFAGFLISGKRAGDIVKSGAAKLPLPQPLLWPLPHAFTSKTCPKDPKKPCLSAPWPSLWPLVWPSLSPEATSTIRSPQALALALAFALALGVACHSGLSS